MTDQPFKFEVKADLSDDFQWIHIYFDYQPQLIASIRQIPGAKFIGRDKGGPYWKVKADLDLARSIRRVFGEDLKLSTRLKKWGQETVGHVGELMSLAAASDAELTLMPEALPELYAFINGEDVTDMMGTLHVSPTPEGRPYQRADISFHAKGKRTGNFNHPGTGKTFEAIAAVFEAGTDEGPNLVLAPVTSLDVVWEDTLIRWQPHPIFTATGGRADREAVIRGAQAFYENDEPFWMIVNPAMVTYGQERTLCYAHAQAKKSQYPEDRPKASEIRVCPECKVELIAPYPELQEWEWRNLIVDEFHKCGLGNPDTQTSKALKDLNVTDLIIDISGTPMQGKPIKLFSVLQHLYPADFTSKWRFAAQWLEIEEQDRFGKVINGVRPEKEEEFAEMLSRYFVRRTKAEVLPWLPAKQHVEMWVEMTPTQERQYKQFAAQAEVTIEDQQLGALGILAEYTRLRQFANAYCVIDGQDSEGRPIVKPTQDSGKLPVILDILEDRGITKDQDIAGGDEQVVIFSQFTRMVDMVHAWLAEQGVPSEKLTGATSQEERTRLVREFQSAEGVRVLVMNTMAGGVSITLDRASTVIFLDETWTPDDQEQAEDRVHRGSRDHQVVVYYIRSKGSIESMIQDGTGRKAITNENILDAHREGFRVSRLP